MVTKSSNTGPKKSLSSGDFHVISELCITQEATLAQWKLYLGHEKSNLKT